MNKEEGLKALETSIKAIEDLILSKKGTFVLQQAVSYHNMNAIYPTLLFLTHRWGMLHTQAQPDL